MSRLRVTSQRSIISFAGDWPNVCSLLGLCCATTSLYFALLEIFPLAMIGLLWAVFFDWTDGVIARRLKDRTKDQRAVGGQLDSLIDVVSFSVCPAVVLLSYGRFSPWFLPGAVFIVGTGVIRLSYFNVFGLVDKSTYMGLALDNNVVVLAFAFLFEGLIGHAAFAIIIYVLLIALAALNVSPIRTPKFSGRWYYALIAYCLALTLAFGRQLAAPVF